MNPLEIKHIMRVNQEPVMAVVGVIKHSQTSFINGLPMETWNVGEMVRVVSRDFKAGKIFVAKGHDEACLNVYEMSIASVVICEQPKPITIEQISYMDTLAYDCFYAVVGLSGEVVCVEKPKKENDVNTIHNEIVDDEFFHRYRLYRMQFPGDL